MFPRLASARRGSLASLCCFSGRAFLALRPLGGVRWSLFCVFCANVVCVCVVHCALQEMCVICWYFTLCFACAQQCLFSRLASARRGALAFMISAMSVVSVADLFVNLQFFLLQQLVCQPPAAVPLLS